MKKKKLFAVIITFLLFVLCLLFVPVLQVLVIKQFNSNDRNKNFVSHYAAKNGFVICYTHSVNKGRVYDYYKTSPNGNLLLYKTSFVNYGAGISEPEEIPGAMFEVLDDGRYAITGINRELSQLVMAVGVIANHSLQINQCEIVLTDYFESQTRLLFFIKRVSLFEYLFLTSRF